MLKTHDEAQVVLSDAGATVSLPRTFDHDRGLELGISCQQIDWQLSSLAQVCGPCFPQAVEHLYILERQFSPHRWEDDIENQLMAGTFSFISHRQEFLLVQGIGTTCHACPSKVRRGWSNRGVTRPSVSLLEGSTHLEFSRRPLASSELCDSSPIT